MKIKITITPTQMRVVLLIDIDKTPYINDSTKTTTPIIANNTISPITKNCPIFSLD